MCETRYKQSAKRLRLHLLLGVSRVSNRAALHEYDGLMSVFPYWSCGQAIDPMGICFFQNSLEVYRRHMMALINNNHAVFRDKRFYLSIGYAGLNKGDINDTMQRIAVRTECADRGRFFLACPVWVWFLQVCIRLTKTCLIPFPIAQGAL